MIRRILVLSLLLLMAVTVTQAATITKVSKPDTDEHGYSVGDSLVAGASDTSDVFIVKQMDNLSLWIQCDSDSTTMAIQTSMDGTVWKNYLAAAYLGGTKTTNTCVFHKYLNLTAVNGTDYGPVHLGNFLRVILKNTEGTGTTNVATRSGVKSIAYYLQGVTR